MYRYVIIVCGFLNGSVLELNELMFEVKGNVYKEYKFLKLFFWSVRINNIFYIKVLKFLVKGKCIFFYEFYVLFIKWFEFVGEIEVFLYSLYYRFFILGKFSFLLCEKFY